MFLGLPFILLAAGCSTEEPEMPLAQVVREPQNRPTRTPPSRPVPRPQRPPPIVETPAKPSLAFRDAVAVQTLLDRANLSCGCDDGTMGSRTHTALRAWQELNGLPPSGELDELTLTKLGPLDRAFTTRVVTAEDHAEIAPVPHSWLGKSQAQRLGYETILEAVAEETHAAEDTLRALNPDATWPNPKPGTLLTVPNPKPFPIRPASRIAISLSLKTVRVYDDHGALLALFPCSIARDKEKRPVGELKVVNGAANPNYYFDPALFVDDEEAQTMTSRLVIPPGPNNPVGTAWISLNLSGYGIHGTPYPEDIGKTESHGCFRLANWNADKLLKMIRIGIPVAVER